MRHPTDTVLPALRRFYQGQVRLQQLFVDRHLYAGTDAVDAMAGRLRARL